MRQEIDARTQYLLQNHSLIEDSVPKEPEPEIEDDQEEEKLRNEPKP